MNRELAQTVVASFRTRSAQVVERQLAPFSETDWMRTRSWLHTSGLALYLVDRVTALGIPSVIPQELFRGLSVNLKENRVRTADLFDEFVKINTAFQRAEILYANVKGFTLAPSACSDPALRYQHDLDFLVARHDAERCRQVLSQWGYIQTLVSGDSWEFHAGPAAVCSMRDLYRVRAQRSVELHLVPEAEEECANNRLSRLQLQVWSRFEFPALSSGDRLLLQATHLFHHFLSEWTRTAWLLEYAAAIRAQRADGNIWRQVEAILHATPEIRTGVGMASLIASRTFAVKLPPELARVVDALPPRVRLWIDRYEQSLVFTEHPGSKLYLLLKDVLFEGSPDWPRQKRKKLVPWRLPQKIVVAKSGSMQMSLRVNMAQIRFVLQRLRFHIVTGLRYRLEAARWRRILAGSQW